MFQVLSAQLTLTTQLSNNEGVTLVLPPHLPSSAVLPYIETKQVMRLMQRKQHYTVAATGVKLSQHTDTTNLVAYPSLPT